MNLKFLITRTIYETPIVSQRTLSKKFFVSLGKINSVISEIIDDGLINKSDKEGHYSITTKGIEYISEHKVDGAIILACGVGLKPAPDENELPICFFEINGERLIERQIRQIKAAKIDDIAIMVGFMKEKFDYLIDKYGVKLIYNEEYMYKKTLSTLYHAREILRNKNMYICVSDIYMKDNLFHKYEIESYYTGAYLENCKNEWRIVANSKNEIKEVVVGGTNDFCLVGISFMTKDFIDNLLPLIDEYYNKTFTDGYYWEDVLVQNFNTLPKFYLYKLGMKEIFEFDTLKDISDFEKNNNEFSKSIVDYVASALATGEKKIEKVECISDGIINSLYKFNILDDEYIIRVPKKDASVLANYENEDEILKELKNNKYNVESIIDEVIHFNKNNGYKISKFFKNSRPIDVQNKTEIDKCIFLYKKLHTSGIKVKANCDIIYMIKKYINTIKENNIKIPYEDFDDVIEKATSIKKIIEAIDRPKVLCHGDPNPNNILVANDLYKLTEFEYGGMADPISDIALFGIYLHYDIDQVYEIYEKYENIKINSNSYKSDNNKEVIKRLVICYMALSGLYNALWEIIYGGLHDKEYGTFGLDSYRVFKNCYKEL